jgi:hypothetical protein
MVSEERLREILEGKNHKAALRAMDRDGNMSECWGIYDGVMVIYDEDDPPSWLAKVFVEADEDGHTPAFKEIVRAD